MKDIQNKIKKFNDDRGWSDSKYIKDTLLNMNEEIGELWHLIKWVDVETQDRIVRENKEEVENFIGDMIYLILRISYLYDINSEKAIDKVLKEYEKRFPTNIKGNLGNIKLVELI